MYAQALADEWPALGLDVAEITSVRLIHRKHGNALYRIQLRDHSYVVKHFPPGSDSREMEVYRLFEEGGVPTLPVYALGERAILVEDLATSTSWRLAEHQDTLLAGTGTAVARWYRTLHHFGSTLLQQNPSRAAFLSAEYDALDAMSITRTAEQLGLAALKVWGLARQAVPVLKAALARFPQTICYNDFYWTNLALSRGTAQPEAIVFDYHLVGRGIPYSDCRNVLGSLGAEARKAFLAAYGSMDEQQATLDEPLAILYGLLEAAKRPRLPKWAAPLVDSVRNGHLEQCLREALMGAP